MFDEMSYAQAFDAIAHDLAVSDRLKRWMADAQRSDPVDAINDAEVLVALLTKRLDELTGATR